MKTLLALVTLLFGCHATLEANPSDAGPLPPHLPYAADQSDPPTPDLATPDDTAPPAPDDGGVIAPSGVGNGLGINLREVSYYAPDWLFADAIKSSSIGGASGYGSSVAVDADGWPTADASFLLWPDGIFTGTAGLYKIRFTGQATIGGSFTIANQVYDAQTNLTTADATLAADGFAGLILTNTKRTPTGSGGVTQLECLKPGYVHGDVFTKEAMQLIAKFSVIRFMDFTSTNWSQQKTWGDRTLPTRATQMVDGSAQGYGWEGKGAAWEYAILLANQTHRDAWINIPAQVDDDYVHQLALLIRDGGNGFPPLDPSLHLYVEYSNEVWNGGFSQAHENHDLAVAEVNAGGSPLNYDGLTDSSGWQFAWRRVGKRAVEISNGFRAVFGDAAMMTRVRPVLEWQQDNGQGTAGVELTFIDSYYNNGDGQHVATPHPVSYFLYGGGGSAYYNPNPGVTIDDIWSSGTMSKSGFAPVCQTDVDWTAAYGLRRIAYEGGPSFDKGNDDAVKAMAWGDARMTQSMLDHHATWQANGGDLLVYFQSTGDYQWGFTHDVRQLATPKLQAIDTIGAAAPAAATYGAAVPVTLDASKPSVFNTWNDHAGNMKTGDWFAYTFRDDSGGARQVSATYTTGGGKLVITVDGTAIGAIDLPSGAGSTSAIPVTLGTGVHSIAIHAESGSFGISQLTVK